MVATRARWRVESNSSNSNPCELDDDGAGEGGNMGAGEAFVGKGAGHDDAVTDDVGVGTLRGRPEAAKALITASQPLSSVLIRSRNS